VPLVGSRGACLCARRFLDPADRILLVHFSTGVWATPGGGIDAGETDEDALHRELAEEIGLTSFAPTRLAACFAALLEHGAPAAPIDVGVSCAGHGRDPERGAAAARHGVSIARPGGFLIGARSSQREACAAARSCGRANADGDAPADACYRRADEDGHDHQ
jgi:hypothetical protein